MDHHSEDPILFLTKNDLMALTECIEKQLAINKEMLVVVEQLAKQLDLPQYKDRQADVRINDACRS